MAIKREELEKAVAAWQAAGNPIEVLPIKHTAEVTPEVVRESLKRERKIAKKQPAKKAA